VVGGGGWYSRPAKGQWGNSIEMGSGIGENTDGLEFVEHDLCGVGVPGLRIKEKGEPAFCRGYVTSLETHM